MDSLLIPILITIFIVTIGSMMSSRKNRKKQKASWRRFAQVHNLSFVSDDNFLTDGAYVTGSYRGYNLKLESFEKKHNKNSYSYTRITLVSSLESGPLLSHAEALKYFDLPLKFTTDFQDSSNEIWLQKALQRVNSLGNQTTQSRDLALKKALNRLNSSSRSLTSKVFKADSGGRTLYFEQFGIIQDMGHIESILGVLVRLTEAYASVLNFGTEAIPSLIEFYHTTALQPILKQLLSDIAHQNFTQLEHRAPRLLCPNCLTRFDRYRLQLLGQEGPLLFGCRTCLQSHKYLEGTVIAVLYTQLPATPVEQDGLIRVNWLIRRELFDFDAVEIVNASDEEVERFAVQVGNDTDEFRRPRYREMRCVVSPQCGLSENSLRILRRTFGQVEIG